MEGCLSAEARRVVRRRRSSGGFLNLEYLLLLLAIAAAVWAFVPDYLRVRRALPVEEAAWSLRLCDLGIWQLRSEGVVTNLADITLPMLEEHLRSRNRPELRWPEGADLRTLDFSRLRGSSVEVDLPDGSRRRVFASDMPESHIH
jgi:hypothetical protein